MKTYFLRCLPAYHPLILNRRWGDVEMGRLELKGRNDLGNLKLLGELTPNKFAEIGHVTGGFNREDGAFIAVCSEFQHFYWPGRAVYEGHKLRYRLSLYNSNLDELVSVFDEARFPINNVAFHPTNSQVAIATGNYDGGWCFEGDLWLWNWETGETTSLLGESREVSACRFDDDGRLVALIRPRDEEEFETDEEDGSFKIFLVVSISDFRSADDAGQLINDNRQDARLLGLEPVNPRDHGFHDGPFHPKELRENGLNILKKHKDFEERVRAWDVAWLSTDELGLVHDNCFFEVWNRDGTRLTSHVGEGSGVQLLSSSDGFLVHVLCRANLIDNTDDRSTLLQLSNAEVREVLSVNHAASFSTDQSGNIFCRDVGSLIKERARKDRLFTRDMKEILALDLGHYDCFNHYLRLDSQERHYFLRGTPASSHQNKQLCSLVSDGTISEVRNWDNRGRHLMNSIVCACSDKTLIRAYKVYHPHPGEGEMFIERTEIGSERTFWLHPISALVTSMVLAGDKALIYTLTDGTMGMLDIVDGRLVYQDKLSVSGISTVAMSLAVNDTYLAVGTIDARILLYDIDFGVT